MRWDKIDLKYFWQVLNIFIIIKITKSARFRKQFRRHDDEDEQDDPDTDQEDLIQQRNKKNNISGNSDPKYKTSWRQSYKINLVLKSQN